MAIKVAIGLQARISSKRFPNKIFHELEPEQTVLDFCLKRALEIKHLLHKFDVSISLLVPIQQIQLFEHVAKNYQVDLVGGPEDNVLKRFINMQKTKKADYVMRLTADCPLMVTEEIVQMAKEAVHLKYDYGTLLTPDDWFDGTDAEIFTSKMLKELSKYASNKQSKMTWEHVTYPLKNDSNFFAHKLFWPKRDLYKEVPKLSIDTTEDFMRVRSYLSQCFWIK